MKKRRRFLTLSLVLIILLTFVQVTAAHPLGNFTINRYSHLLLDQQQVNVTYIVDMAEIPTFQERQIMDSDGDEVVSAEEEAAYLQRQVTALVTNLHLSVNGTKLKLTPQSWSLVFPPGQGDLPTLRLELLLTAPLPTGQETWQAEYHDDNYAERLGWQEVVVAAAKGANLLDSSAPAQDISNGLRAYPEDLLQNPPAVNRATFRFAPVSMTAETETAVVNTPLAQEAAITAGANEQNRFGQDEFANLLSTALDSPRAVLFALVVALGLGAAHALTPGHGKTIVGAYLVGSRGTATHALFLGLTTTITHTAGVFAFGLLVLFASQFILPEQLYPWLGVLSGLLVTLIGFSLFRSHLRTARGQGQDNHPGNDEYHTHFGVGHTHAPRPGADGVSWRSLVVLGVSGGLLPCPSALVLLLVAIALQRVGFGLLLIVAFSVGLASVLTAIGITLVYAGRLLERLPVRRSGLVRLLPVASASFITLAGIGITVQALLETGVL